MKKKLVKKVIAGIAIATTAALPLCAVAPIKAEAFSIGGAIVGALGGLAQGEQVKESVAKYNDDDNARQELFNQMRETQGVNDDPYLNERVKNIMDTLTQAVGSIDPSIYDKPYNYFINKDETFNAACGLGHNMTINTGLFGMTNNDSEIAAVLGHEMGHGQKDHVVKSVNSQVNNAILTGAIAGGLNTYLGSIAASIANVQLNSSYSKGQETEADNLAFDYLTRTDYNIGACAALWQRVIEKEGSGESSLLGNIFYPSDHPGHESRRDNYADRLKEYSNNHVSVADGLVKVNDKDFVSPAASAEMSNPERAYFIAGNLARIYHDNETPGNAFAENGTVYMDGKAVITSIEGDIDAQTLANILNAIR